MAQSDSMYAGAVPEIYDRERGPLFFQPFARDMARRLGGLTEGCVLETASGTGILTLELVGILPESVAITATDLNQPMLDHARAKPALARVTFQQADAQALPFPNESFDAVLCQFGVMFFPNRVKAYAEARRVLRPGGRFLFNAWDKLANSPVPQAALAGLARAFPQHTTWFLERTPYGYHEPDVIRRDMQAAGWAKCSIEVVTLTGHATSAHSAAVGLCQGTPMRGEIEGLGPDALARGTAAAAESIAARFGEGPFEAPIQALVAEAAR